MGRGGPEELGLYKVFRDIGDKGRVLVRRWYVGKLLPPACKSNKGLGLQLERGYPRTTNNWQGPKCGLIDRRMSPFPPVAHYPQLIWKDIRIGQVGH